MLNQKVIGLGSCLIHSVSVESFKMAAPDEFC